MKQLRCAIYTRKSSEEGLDQSFNSLDAQRESCEAYIASQKSEGWSAISTLFDDGGYSGGTMARPALERLLRDIAAGLIDVVVVYKVDRLTRALADFAKIVEVFDGHGVSFVSVTQAFNTTSSMGRLTLNVLLSFAQFEREVTGERIRDKIAASKAKGMWMGGYPPLGYEVENRRLIVVESEAATVRHVFTRYLTLKSVNALAQELRDTGVRSKWRTSAKGTTRGGAPYSRGALFHLLRNRIYIGEIVHKKQNYPGRHDGIVEPNFFERAQRQLAENTVCRPKHPTRSAPLGGLIFDAAGVRMSPTHAYGKSGGTYRYYVSTTIQTRQAAASAECVSRVSARVIEDVVLHRLRTMTDTPAASWSELLPCLRRVGVHARGIVLEVAPPSMTDWKSQMPAEDMVEDIDDKLVRIHVTACTQPRKGTSSLIAPVAQIDRRYFDRPLIAALKRAHQELTKQKIQYAASRLEVSEARGLCDPYLRRIAPLAFLAPDIQRCILEGRQPPGLTLNRIIRQGLPLSWTEQRARFGILYATLSTWAAS